MCRNADIGVRRLETENVFTFKKYINSYGRKKTVLVSERNGCALHIFAKNLQRPCDAFSKTGLSLEVILKPV